MRTGVAMAIALFEAACTGDPVRATAADGAAGTGAISGFDASPDAADSSGDSGDSGTVGPTPELLAAGRDCPSDLRALGGTVTWVDQGSAQNSGKDGMVVTMPAVGCAGDASSCIDVLAKDQYSPAAVELNLDAVYWSTVGDGTIWNLPTQSTTPQSFAPSQNLPRFLAIDLDALYWTNSGSGTAPDGEIRRKYLDGGSPEGLPIASALDAPFAIVLLGDSLFWTNDGTSDTTGYVMTSDILGAGAKRIAENQSHPRGIAVDANYVYWTNTGDGTINRAKHDGSESKRLIVGRATPSDIAVDADGIYWVDAGTPIDFADGAVLAAKLDGTGIVTLADKQLDPRRLVLDSTHVYWIDRGTQGVSKCTQHDGAVMRAAKPF